MPDSDAKKAWTAANTTRIVMNLNHNTDADILQKLSSVPNRQGYIKALIRADLERAQRERRSLTRLQREALERMQATLEQD